MMEKELVTSLRSWRCATCRLQNLTYLLLLAALPQHTVYDYFSKCSAV